MSDQDPIDDVRHRVDLWNQQMDACLMRGDLLGYAAFYSDEATIIGYDKRKIQGREAIDRFFLAMTGIKEAKAVVLEVGVGGDLIYQVATSFASGEGMAKREAICAIACMSGAKRTAEPTASSWMRITRCECVAARSESRVRRRTGYRPLGLRSRLMVGSAVRSGRQYAALSENPRGSCPNHATGVRLPDDFVVRPLQYAD